ncbi:hypothetical protein [Psychromonas sp. Urea-02u-13]|uniref:hypothetical protein n=1 Tax=Psychromonas sp. Urea-02u-13 TaxID=2058326 RepID=UPI000C325421|nr:hypothetical protein [Psychromonas sp. Urea-02u-13]PKG39677.1 hypothetical protein CXF74_06910 [Psychromonas sp. Urea-02u-13]
MKVAFTMCTLLLLIAGCSTSDSTYSPLSDFEQQQLQTYQLNHAFLSGCVTEKLADINRDYCDKENNFCNIPPEATFNFLQWLVVYQACIAK